LRIVRIRRHRVDPKFDAGKVAEAAKAAEVAATAKAAEEELAKTVQSTIEEGTATSAKPLTETTFEQTFTTCRKSLVVANDELLTVAAASTSAFVSIPACAPVEAPASLLS